MQVPAAPRLAILDWMMPELQGPEVVRRIRSRETSDPPYLIILTTRRDKSDLVAGLNGGANDYLSKPFDLGELQARVEVGQRMLELQTQLAEQVAELRSALEHIKTLEGILPICSYCRKVRDDAGYWRQLEAYIAQHSDARFSHGICPECLEKQLALLHQSK
jgi:sigma-B regulation protein RsbU (phosphoserine phosphatase)